jgi:putative CocE/NonD family hydrolase
MRLEADVGIPMQDGVTLRGDLYRPKGAGRFPALIAWSSYTKELHTAGVPMPFNEIGAVGYFVRRGYCHLTVNARGTGKSGGEQSAMLSPQEQADAAETIRWAANQPWCDGNVGMIGMSYFAIIQYLAAAQQTPFLKAIFPYQALTDVYRHAIHKGGTLHSQFLAGYTAFHGSTQWLSIPPAVRNAAGYFIDRPWSRFLFPRVFPRALPLLIRFFRPSRAALEHYVRFAFDEPFDGAVYRERSPASVFDRIQIPVCIGSNWGSVGLHLMGAFDAWHRLQAPKRLFIGPPEAVWPWKSYQREVLAWYDTHLKGLNTGYESVAPVRYWLQGANEWRSATGWPVPGAAVRKFFLQGQSQNGNGHALSAMPASEDTASFLAIPAKMTYPRHLDRSYAQRLTYATAPFEEDTDIVGPVHVHLRISSTALDTFVIARLSDSAPNGRLTKLCFGWLELSHRKVDAARSTPTEIVHDSTAPEPLTPGKPVAVDFSLTPTANRFRRGHRMVLEIASRADLLKATFREQFVFFLWDGPPYPARNVIHHGGEDASHVAVHVMGAGDGNVAGY